MSDSLVIRFLAGIDGNAEWLLVDGTGGRMGMVLSGSLAEALPLATNRKVLVLIPGTDALLANPLLPLKRGSQVEQLARYALEEQLASDVDELHFALGKRRRDGTTPVVAIGAARFESYLAELAAAGIHPDAVYVDADLTPVNKGGSTIVVERGLLWVRQESQRAAVLDIQPLSDALLLALPSKSDAEPVTVAETLLYISQGDFEASAAELENCRQQHPTLQVKVLPEGALPLFALQAATAADDAVNLLYGRHARKKSWNKALAPWRFAAVLCGIALTLYVATSAAQLMRLSRLERQLDTQIVEVLQQTLPAADKNPRTARRQFEALMGAQRGGEASGLLRGLQVLGTTIEQVPDTRIDNLMYRTRTIDLRLSAPTVDALDRVRALVKEQGIPAELQSTTTRDNRSEGVLQIKAPEA